MRNIHARGNVIFIILIAIALTAALTFAVTRLSGGAQNTQNEQIGMQVDRVIGFAADVKRAVTSVYQNGVMESDISFANSVTTDYGTPDTNAAHEIFNIAGGGADFITVPTNANNGSNFEFYGFSAAPQVGTSEADLMVVLPNVTESFCRSVNTRVGYAAGAAIPVNATGECVNDPTKRFTGSFATGSDINTMDGSGATGFKVKPASYGCVACAGPVYNFYYVVLER